MKHPHISALLSIVFFSFVNANAQTVTQTGVDSAFKNATADVIYYYSDTLKLKGYLQKPEGKGPFPVYIWNHDSEKDPVFYINLSQFWVKRGYVFFMPIRSGQSDNRGEYICNVEKQIQRRRGEMAQLQFRQIYALHKKYNEDVIAAIKWIKKQPYADTNKIVVAGVGYGGIQTLITAEKDGQSSLGVKCFIAMSPASTIWYKMWGDSLIQAVNMAKRPIFILQPNTDKNMGPTETLGPVLEKKGEQNRSKVFQADAKSKIAFFDDPEIWGKDVLKYLKDCGVKGKKE